MLIKNQIMHTGNGTFTTCGTGTGTLWHGMKQFCGGLHGGKHCKNGAGLASGPILQLASEPIPQLVNEPKPEPKHELNPLLKGKLNELKGLNPENCPGKIARGARPEFEKLLNDGGGKPLLY